MDSVESVVNFPCQRKFQLIHERSFDFLDSERSVAFWLDLLVVPVLYTPPCIPHGSARNTQTLHRLCAESARTVAINADSVRSPCSPRGIHRTVCRVHIDGLSPHGVRAEYTPILPYSDPNGKKKKEYSVRTLHRPTWNLCTT